MKKIAIITIKDNNNLGNRLQNYAVQKIYEDMGFRAITIKNSCQVISMNRYKLFILDFFKSILEWIKGKTLKKNSRKYCFNSFDKYINYSFHYICNQNAEHFLRRFDYVSVGSDQVWNYNIGRLSDVELLKYTPYEKNIAFSASAAVEEFPAGRTEELKNAFNNFSHISVREKKTQNLIFELTGRNDIELFLDPTLLLTAEDWHRLEKKPVFLNEKYILIYFLSEQNEDIYKQINEYAKEHSLRLVDVSKKRTIENNIGPSEFLYLEHHADCIFTDSFHACVFAINYNRPFYVFKRSDGQMFSRIESLIEQFHLESCVYDGVILNNSLSFSYANILLDNERNNTVKKIKSWIE